MKTGSTWLYAQLADHPDVRMPPVKELRYFWERAFLPKRGRHVRLTSRHWYYESMRDGFMQWVRRIPELDRETNLWFARYYFAKHDDALYRRLMTPPAGTITGDVSPNYYQLPDESLAHIKRLYPEARVIVVLRNPIERAWSLAKMILLGHQNLDYESIERQRFHEVFDAELHMCPSYVRLVERWRTVFGAENVHVDYYDRLTEAPLAFRDGIARFLAIDPAGFTANSDELTQRQNAGHALDVPDVHRSYLVAQYREFIAECRDAGYEYADSWGGDAQ